MACYYPKLAVDYGINPDTGKHRVKFLSNYRVQDLPQLKEKHGSSLYMLPCGSCLGCKMDKARDWATRCYLESFYHEQNCFITLTYDEEHCPLLLSKSDVLRFIKSLRNSGVKCRYLLSGEYGSHNSHRPHYHIILFGYKPGDLVFYRFGSNHDKVYTSKILDGIWQKGQVYVGDVTFRSAGYVARYTTKKVGQDGSFILMSNRPGIGMQYLEDHLTDLLKYDSIVGDFGSMSYASLPRAFNKRIQERYPEEYEKIKRNRVTKSQLMDTGRMNNLRIGHLEEYLQYRSSILDDKLKRIERM